MRLKRFAKIAIMAFALRVGLDLIIEAMFGEPLRPGWWIGAVVFAVVFAALFVLGPLASQRVS